MKRVLISFLALSLLLVGCGNSPKDGWPSGPALSGAWSDPSSDPAEAKEPFAVTLPEAWEGRATAEDLEDGVDIVIDGMPMLQLRVVENIPGAREKAEALQANGYEWDYRVQTASSRYFYFIKAAETLPEELYLSEERMKPQEHADYALQEIMAYPLERDLFDLDSFECKYTKENTYGTFAGIESYGVLKSNTYTNHIWGFSFMVPESIREKCWFRVTGHWGVSLYFRSGDSKELHSLCTFFAYAPDHPLKHVYTYPEQHPDTFFLEDGYLYGAINKWRPDAYHYLYHKTDWYNIPLNCRNQISTEEVQQIVDSFTILESNP